MVAVGQPTEGPPLTRKWKPPTVGGCHAHPTVLAVLFRMVCVAMHVFGVAALGVSTSGVGAIVSGEAGEGGVAVGLGCGVGRAYAVLVAARVACGVWPGSGAPTLVWLACPMGLVLWMVVVRWRSRPSRFSADNTPARPATKAAATRPKASSHRRVRRGCGCGAAISASCSADGGEDQIRSGSGAVTAGVK